MPEVLIAITVALPAGALLGGLWVALRAGRRQSLLQQEIMRLTTQLATQEARAGERSAALTLAEEQLAAAFSRLAGDSLARNSEAFLRLAQENLGRHQEKARAELGEREQAVAALLAPIREALDRTTQQISTIEKERAEAFGGIRAQLASMTSSQQQLQAETRNLVNALRRPEVRGQWGELTLRRVAELSGMVEHCDFTEQETLNTPGGMLRPDMVVRLPDRGALVVDVKTPLDAYLEAIDAGSEADRRAALQRHARNVAGRVRELSAKAYWAQFPESPEFVILFIPGEQFLSAALSENPALLEDALRNKVVLTTPSSLVALLKAIAYGWRQLSLERNAEDIRHLGQELYERLTPFLAHMARLGRQIEGSVRAFNDSVGSLEGKVLPGARRLTELGISGRQKLDSPEQVQTTPRQLAAADASVEASAAAGPEAAGTADDLPRSH
ncbi:MAG: DNA recombination protein RmuC [Gammaproteobacteria bacterium]|nr:DNA recombination protein RmuC [Gammaproteobacteria bacterium]